MEEEVSPVTANLDEWRSISVSAISSPDVTMLADELLRARYPTCSHVVFRKESKRCRRAPSSLRTTRDRRTGVCTEVRQLSCGQSSLSQGNTWSEPHQNIALGQADLVLVLDSDVPWIPVLSKPAKTAKVYHIDVDPLKERRPLWYIPAQRVFRADVATVLQQINEQIDRSIVDQQTVKNRLAHYQELSRARRAELIKREQEHASRDVITPEYLTSRIRHHFDGNTIYLIEGVTNNKAIFDHLCTTRPGSVFTSGGGSLGWNGGAAIGVKMALPEETVVSLTGDGTYLFTAPSSVHWMSRRYDAPFLQIVYNNHGWKAPKLATLAVHPKGYASKAQDLGVDFEPQSDYAGIATAAGGAFGQVVKHPSEIDSALANAIKVLQTERRSVVLDIWLASF